MTKTFYRGITSSNIFRNGYLWGVILVGVTAFLAWLIHAAALTFADTIFLPAVLIVALRWGLGPSLLTSFLSLASYITFIIVGPDEVTRSIVIHFGEMGGVFVMVSVLASKSRNQTLDLQGRARIKLMLLRLSNEVVGTTGVQEIALRTVKSLKQILDAEAVLLMPEKGQLRLVALSSESIVLSDVEYQIAVDIWQQKNAAQREGNALHNEFIFYPLSSAGRIIGILGIQHNDKEWLFNPSRRPFLQILTVTIAAAIEREVFAESAAEANILRRQEELNTALLSSISHDFRTPLASIIGAAETLSLPGAVFSEETKEDILKVIREEAERLNRFVANLLDMTRLEAGGLKLHLERVGVEDVVGAAIHQLGRLLDSRKIVIDIEPEMPMIHVDFVLMEHVLMNLLENAARYTPPGSPIHVRVWSEGDYGVISVVDEGKGISPDELDHIFEKFYRVEHGDIRSAGTGLGLLICKGIVEAHGGEISAISPVAEGKGTMIRFTLPLNGNPQTITAGDAVEQYR